ncbi:MAG: IS5 family transposase [Bacteroidales bacterium]|nr:IS5 family transposase [Bacteroidales bacterium]
MYPTDLTDSHYEVIKVLVEDKRKRKYSLKRIISGILYLCRTGAQWRLLPKDFPAWQLVYYYFHKWMKMGLWEKIQNLLRRIVRKKNGRKEEPSMAIIDSQSVKNSEWGIPEKGFDGNKRIKGRKRHIIVDTLGILLGIIVTEANVHDSVAAEVLLKQMKGELPRLKKILGDAGYMGDELVRKARIWLNSLFEVVRRSDEKGFRVIPTRWIVERSIAWFNWYRRLSKDYEANMETSENWAYIASIDMLLRKI